MARSAASNRFTNRAFGTSLSFATSSTNNVLVSSNAILSGFTNWSITAWVKFNVSSGAQSSVYAERGASGNDLLRFEIRGNSGGIGNPHPLGITYRDDAGTLNQLVSTGSFTPGSWHHVAITKAGTAITYYIDGVSAGTSVLTATDTFTDASRASHISYDGVAGGTNMEGKITDSAIWTSTLSAAQIASVYFSNSYSSTGIKGQWPFNEGSGTSATDSSGNGNTGTITGATYSTDVPMIARTASGSRTAAGTRSAA